MTSGLAIAFLMLVVSSETVSASEAWFAFRSLHRILQCRNRLRVFGECLLLSVSRSLGLGGRRLRIRCLLLSLLQLIVFRGKVALQAVDLALHLLPQGIDLIFH